MPKHNRPPGRQLHSVALRYRQQGNRQQHYRQPWDDRAWPPSPVRGSIAWRSAGCPRPSENPSGSRSSGATSPRDARMAHLEAVLFLAAEPLSSRKLGQLAGLADGTEARTLIRQLNGLYKRRESAFRALTLVCGCASVPPMWAVLSLGVSHEH